jgi:hypothetical protein
VTQIVTDRELGELLKAERLKDGLPISKCGKPFSSKDVQVELEALEKRCFPKEESAQVPFALFRERALQLCNSVFGDMYHKIFKKYWRNGFHARMVKNYCATDQMNGFFEVYIPTKDNVDFNMQYYHIVVKVVPELDFESLGEAYETPVRLTYPPGIIDSELVAVVAPNRSIKARIEKQRFEGRRLRSGWFNAVIVNPTPEICMKRLLTLIAKFLENRLLSFFNSINLTEAIDEWLKLSINSLNLRRLHLLEDNVLSLIGRISLSLKNMVACLSHSLDWILDKLKMVLGEVGRQYVLKQAVKKALELKNLLKGFQASDDHPPIIKKLMKAFNTEAG